MKAESIESGAPHRERELERLLAFEHHDPHSILGAHLEGNRLVVRAFRPDASSINLLVPGDAPRPPLFDHLAGGLTEYVRGTR